MIMDDTTVLHYCRSELVRVFMMQRNVYHIKVCFIKLKCTYLHSIITYIFIHYSILIHIPYMHMHYYCILKTMSDVLVNDPSCKRGLAIYKLIAPRSAQ